MFLWPYLIFKKLCVCFLTWRHHRPPFSYLTYLLSALSKKECLRRQRRSKRQGSTSGSSHTLDGTLDRDHEISMPTKLTQLRYSGYSAEFLDRVEPNGNIPGKNGTTIAGTSVGSSLEIFGLGLRPLTNLRAWVWSGWKILANFGLGPIGFHFWSSGLSGSDLNPTTEGTLRLKKILHTKKTNWIICHKNTLNQMFL